MAEIVRLDHSAFARDGLCHRRPTVLYIAWQELPYRIMCERCHVEWGRYATLAHALHQRRLRLEQHPGIIPFVRLSVALHSCVEHLDDLLMALDAWLRERYQHEFARDIAVELEELVERHDLQTPWSEEETHG